MLRTLMLAAAACGFVAVGAASAQPEHGWHHEGLEILHGAGLTDAQKAQVHQLVHAQWQQMKPIMEQVHSIHEQIVQKYLTAGALTAGDIQPLVQQEESLRAQIDNARVNTALQIRALLSPDQLAKAAAAHQQLESLHEQEREVLDHNDDETPQ